MQLETLRFLLALEQWGSTRKAADNLNTSYQNVSRVLHLAEEELGCQLFKRTSKGLLPTVDGHLALESAKKMLIIYDDMLDKFQKKDTQKSSRLLGKLFLHSSIVVSNSFINDVLLEFSRQYPKVQIKVVEEDAYAPIGEQEGRLYFVPRTTWDIETALYPTTPLLKDKMTLLVKKDSVFNSQKTISLKKVMSLPLALITNDTWENSIFGRILLKQNLVPQNPLYISSIMGFQKYVGSGQYVGLSTEKLAHKLVSGQKSQLFQIIPIRDKSIDIYHCLVIREPDKLSALEERFVDFLKEYFHD